MKSHIGEVTKPNTMQELVHGILEFWNEKVTIEYCNSKINHLFKVIDTTIALNGQATGL